jgi:hypothetical protein
MNFKRLMIVIGAVVLVAVIALSWGCQNQPTGPKDITKMEASTPPASSKTRETGSCSAGSFRVSFSGAKFVTGIGWSTGSTRTISWSGSCSGCSWGPGVYGWLQNPLVEYYIPRSGGSGKGSYSCNGTWNVGTNTQTNQPSIEGTKTFQQYFASGGGQPINMGCHYDGWRSKGLSVGSNNYQVVAVENWSGGSGSASVSVSGSNWYTNWVGSGSVTFTCGGGGGGSTSTTTTSGGGSTTTTSGGGGGSNSIVVRARGTNGSEHIYCTVGGSQIGSWTLSTSMSNYSASTNNTGGINVYFDNDGTNRDVQVDYITVNGSTRQAENQGTNTGVWQNNSCGGSNSEWLHCNGYIGFGDVSGGGGGSTTTTTSGGGSTTTSGGGGSNRSYTLRARSTDGQGKVNLRIDNNTIATFTLGSSMGNYTASSYNTGGINVEFFNDATNRDVQIDYLVVNGSTRQAESQGTNTGVWNGSGCGGSNSEWLHCNGYIGFGNTP